ncbi:MAG: polyprenyl synthetase family protein [Opitutales bacterium]
MSASFSDTFDAYISRVQSAIPEHLPSVNQKPEKLHQAMHYSMMAGGKRLRPVMLLACAEGLGSSRDLLPAAVALECLHTYTLIHDDLPAVDNSDLRRGRPTCHVEFDESTAILAGDGLLNYTFELLSEAYLDEPAIAVRLIKELSIAGGSRKLIGGQMTDIEAESQQAVLSGEELEFIHRNKTAALIQASVRMGSVLADSKKIEEAGKLGFAIGMAFQVIDDILDATQTTEALGKPAGLDDEREKSTYVSIYGLDEARLHAERYSAEAESLASGMFGAGSFFHSLVQSMSKRLS